MPNQVVIPFKKTYVVPVQQAVRSYIQNYLPDSHPDAFKWDMNKWESLRMRILGETIHIDRIKDMLSYQAQLTFILTKLPPDIKLDITYAPAFSPAAHAVTLPNLIYDRCGTLFNLAALFSGFAAAEDRSNPEGLKRASKYHQNAAGTLSHLGSIALSKLRSSLLDEPPPLEFTDAFIKSLEWLMLAQGQECAWQLAASKSGSSSSIIARLSTQVSLYYGSAASTIRDATPQIKHLFPSNWLAHIQAKQYHFEAAAQYRKSNDDLEANRYGNEIARLSQAQKMAKEAYELARKGGVAPAVLQDISSLMGVVKENLVRAERDNNLIYHNDVPSLPSLPPISPASMVKSDIPSGLQDPQSIVQSDVVIFGELLAWGAKEAIDIYNDRKKNLISEEIEGYAKELDGKADGVLRALHLPASLEALSKPIGLPPSLLRKAQEIREGNIPTVIESSVERIQDQVQKNAEILDNAIQILDDEAENDDSFRQTNGIDRPPSFEANKPLIEKHGRYRIVLDQALESDKEVRNKWEEWQENIVSLTWDEAELEASVPSTTLAPNNSASSVNSQTKRCARALRVLLEGLDNIRNARKQILQRSLYEAESDNIKSRVMRQAAGIERWAEVQPSMFEDTLDQELGKYDKFKTDLEDGAVEQQELLEEIEARNVEFLNSRVNDQTVKQREHAIQSLELAYHKCKEIQRNLEEGIKFHLDFGNLLSQFRDQCYQWAKQRETELHNLSQSMSSVQIASESVEEPPEVLVALPSKPSSVLPPPDSDEWEPFVLPPAPSPVPQRSHVRSRGR